MRTHAPSANARAEFRVYDGFPGGDNEQLVAVWSAATGALEGIVVGHSIGEYRTGAIGGIAVRHMSRGDAGDVAVIGTGRQARTQLLATALVRSLRNVRVFGRNRDAQKRFVAEMRERIACPVSAAKTAPDAVEGADIVLCASASDTPVIDAQWIAPGAHVNTVGPKTIDAHEIGFDLIERASAIATDSEQQARAYRSPFMLDGAAHHAPLLDLAAVASGTVVARNSDSAITLFCSTGLAGTEVMVAAAVLRALAKNG